MGAQASKRRGPSQLLADAFARIMGRLSPELRGRVMKSWVGRVIVRQIFKAMRREFDPQKAKGVLAVMHWEVAGKEGGDPSRWQVVIEDQRCSAGKDLDREPTVKLKIGAPEFLELATGIAAGPALFMGGKLKVDGDLMLAARLASLFRIPRAVSA